jgi:hypothetical protein
MSDIKLYMPTPLEQKKEQIRMEHLKDRIDKAYKEGIEVNGKVRLERTIISCLLNNIPYKKIREGSTTTLMVRGRSPQRYVTSKRNMDSAIRNCSKSLKNSCIKYEKEYGVPRLSEDYLNNYMGDNISNFILRGNRTLSYVDVDHCYWQIVYVHGIINEHIYLKYKDNRDARLVAMGCRFRSKKTEDVKGFGHRPKTVVEKNPLAWVWHFVNWKAWQAMESCREKFNVFSYHTDGCYLPDSKAKKCHKLLLEKHKLKSKIEQYKIIGWDAHFLVLKNLATSGKDAGKIRRTQMHLTKEAKKAMKHVKASKLIAQWEKLHPKEETSKS